MIERERFEQLAALSASGEASSQEQAELAAHLAEGADHRDDVAEQKSIDGLLRDSIARRETESVPPEVMKILDQVRREALSARTSDQASNEAGDKVALFQPESSPRREWSTWIALAACAVLFFGLAAVWLQPRTGSPKDIVILAPRRETGFTQPTIAWDARPGQRYDVWILGAEGSHIDAPALYIARGVEPPLSLAALKPGPGLKDRPNPSTALLPNTKYRLLVCLADAGRVAGIAVPFYTAPDAEGAPPSASLSAAQKLNASGRPADALMLLLQLPPRERKRPDAQRLEQELRDRLSTPAAP